MIFTQKKMILNCKPWKQKKVAIWGKKSQQREKKIKKKNIKHKLSFSK